MILIYITNPTKKEAKSIVKHLLEKRLIACANIFPIESLYGWQGNLMDEKEFVILGKTSASKYSRLVNEVEKIHSYEIPCVLKIPMEANKKYENWMKEEVS